MTIKNGPLRKAHQNGHLVNLFLSSTRGKTSLMIKVMNAEGYWELF